MARVKITDPAYISEHMFDKVVREKFQDSADDPIVRAQATGMLRMVRAGRTHDQVIADILRISQVSRRGSKEQVAEIGFVMGMQFGFELAMSFPPLPKAISDSRTAGPAAQ